MQCHSFLKTMKYGEYTKPHDGGLRRALKRCGDPPWDPPPRTQEGDELDALITLAEAYERDQYANLFRMRAKSVRWQ